jgi:hypothetical protein
VVFVVKNVRPSPRCALRAFYLSISLLPLLAEGASLKEAEITALIGEGRLLKAGAVLQPILPNDRLHDGFGVSTSANSRAELTFNNQAIVRLSTNAALNFKARSFLELTRGAVLIEMPRGVKTKIESAEVAAGVSGATAVFEYEAPAFKFLVLQGSARLYRPRHFGDSILVSAGRMVFGDARAALTDPVDFDIDRFVKTCPLIQGFCPLGSEELIAAESQKQQRAKSKKTLIATNLVILGEGSTVLAVDPTGAPAASKRVPDSAAAIPNSIPNSTATQILTEARR